MHIHPYEYTHNPTPMSTFKRLSQQILEIDEVTTTASLPMGTLPTIERITTVEFWNKSRKMQTPVLNQGLKP